MHLLRLAPLPLLAFFSFVACNSSSAAGGACASAGGTCLLGPAPECARQAAESAQDCNTTPTPGGRVCCLITYGEQTCDERVNEAGNVLDTVESEIAIDQSCQADTDCVVASISTGCLLGCGTLVNETGAAQLSSAIAQINATICADFTEGGCPAPVAQPCGVFPARCVGGECTNTPVADAGSEAGP